MSSSLSADIVRIIHILVIVFVLVAPFKSNDPNILAIHICICIGLLMHWVANTDGCVLTLLESKLRGKEEKSTFVHSILGPLFRIEETGFTKLTYFVTITVLIISSKKLYELLPK